MCLVRQFECKVILDSELDSIQTLQFRIGLDLHLVVHVTLALQHPLDVLHVLHDPLLDF
jgi:hypothetical protein